MKRLYAVKIGCLLLVLSLCAAARVFAEDRGLTAGTLEGACRHLVAQPHRHGEYRQSEADQPGYKFVGDEVYRGLQWK